MGVGVAYIEVWINLPTAGWTNITNYVRVADGISITVGRADEAGVAGPNKCVFTVDNTDGRFSPTYINGAWFGQIARNLPVKVISVHPSGSGPLDRFWGYIDSLPLRWDQSANNKTVEISCSSISRRLLKSSAELSALKGYVLRPSAPQPFTYWPMEGPSDSARYAPAVGNRSMTATGTATFTSNSYTGLEGSAGLPVLGAGAGFAGPLTPPTSAYLPDVAARMVVKFPAGGVIANGTALMEVYTAFRYFGISYRTGGGLSFHARDSAGVDAIGDSSHAWSVDDSRAVIYFHLQNNGGGGLAWTLGIRKYDAAGVETVQTATGSAAIGYFCPTSAYIARGGGCTGMAVGHVAVSSSLTFWSAGSAPVGFPGEDANDRINRIATSLNTSVYSNNFDPCDLLGPQSTNTPIAAIREAGAAGGGIFCDNHAADGFHFYAWRDLVYTQKDNAYTYTVASGHLAEVPEPTIDDQFVCSSAEVSRTAGQGAAAYITTPAEAVGLTASINAWGLPRCQSAAEDMVYQGSTTAVRLPSMSIDLRRNSSLITNWLKHRPGHAVIISDPPTHLGSDAMRFVLQGWTEYITDFVWRATLNLSPGAIFREVGLFAQAATRRLDTDGATVNGLHNTTTTTISIATTTSTYKPVLSNTAADYNDAANPCLVVASTGEVFRITAVSGTTSPQTATVIRSVNGIVKTLPAGTTLRLYQPFRLAR